MLKNVKLKAEKIVNNVFSNYIRSVENPTGGRVIAIG